MSRDISLYNLVGFHNKQTIKDELHFFRKHDNKIFNIMNGGGYMPGVGFITGICHILFAWMTPNVSTVGRIYLVVRGGTEILGLGILYFIPDVIVSINRHFCTPHYPVISG